MQSIDTLIVAKHVAPVEPRGVLHDHAVAVLEGRIVGVLPRERAEAEFAAQEVVRLDNHVLIPGLVNLHCHAAMSLMRGLADDVPLTTWLQDHVWPAEAKHVSAEFVHDGSLIAMAEMLRAGTTCVNDMYFFPDATARAALRAGMRACLGVITIDFPSAYAADAADYLQKGMATRNAYLGEALLTFCLAPHAPYTVGDETLKRIVVLAEELDVPIHCHVHETRAETEEGAARYGVRPFERLRRLGVAGPRLIAVHAVHMDDLELDVMAREGVTVAHCPSSNLKLASGIARVAADARAVSAAEALEMATLEGARALGLEAEIGSIAPGKAADLAAVELSSLETLPCFDPVSHLVYAAGREHVTHVWVAGRARVAGRRLVDLDEQDLQDKARWWQGRIA